MLPQNHRQKHRSGRLGVGDKYFSGTFEVGCRRTGSVEDRVEFGVERSERVSPGRSVVVGALGHIVVSHFVAHDGR